MVFAKKSYGQHFLRDQSVIEKIITAADMKPADLVVEVGPGTGALTRPISERGEGGEGRRLVLIEADGDLIESLKRDFPKAEIIHADAAQFDFSALPAPWIFVSNLPYNAGNAIIMNVLTSKVPPKHLVVMVQKEVGERILGNDPGLLSVAVQLYATVEKVCRVAPGAFVPPPKVDSVVLKLTPYASAIDRPAVLAVAKAGFANRRKQLHKNLSDAGLFSSEAVKSKLSEFDLSPLARAEELSLDQWISLSTL